jgi:DNA-directed RNA polymerase specialized sigma24 family protein
LGVEDEMFMDIVFRAIEKDLSENQRHVIILRFMEDFTLKETAQIMGKTVTNIKVIQNRAVGILRKALEFQRVDQEFVELSAIPVPPITEFSKNNVPVLIRKHG